MLSYERVYILKGIPTEWVRSRLKLSSVKDAVTSGLDVERKIPKCVPSVKVLIGTLQDERNEFTLR